MSLEKVKLPATLVVAIIAQAVPIIFFVATLHNDVGYLKSEVETLTHDNGQTSIAVIETELFNIKESVDSMGWDNESVSSELSNLNQRAAVTEQQLWTFEEKLFEIDELDHRLDEVEDVSRLLENEMRTIMSDHQSFNAILNNMGYTYSDSREYGNYD